MTTIEIVTGLASTVLLKGSVVLLFALLVARLTARTAARASFVFSIAFATLMLLPFLSALTPDWAVVSLTISHGVAGNVPGTPFSVITLLLGTWVLGALVMLVRLARDLRAAHRLAARAVVVTDARTIDTLRRAANSIGSRIPIAHETDELQTVAIIGHRNPVLLVPTSARGWSDDEMFGVFCHELEHLRRGDWLWFMGERVVAAIYWVNPLAHLATQSAHAAREHAADDAALRGGAGALAYANRLLLVARDLSTAPRLAGSVAFAESGRVDGRVRALFEAHRDRGRVSGLSVVRAALIVLPLVMVLAAFQPWSCLPTG